MNVAHVVIPDTPPSLNEVGFHGNAWQRGARVKRQWQSTVEGWLMASNLARPLPGGRPVHAEATLYFPTKRRRDEDNYRSLLSKVLGDALQAGWLEDDTPEHFTFGRLEFSTGPRQTWITLTWPEAAG